MNLKKILSIVLAIIFIISQNNCIYANLNSERSLVNDVIMSGLKENATLYIGADLELKANVNQEATIKGIEWLTNKENIVTLNASGNTATIKAINEGEVSIMARAIDGSDSSRSINVQVRDFNKENIHFKLPQGIVPIKSYGIINKVFQVEANRYLSSDEKVRSIETYLNIISLNGNLSLISVDKSTYDNYVIYEIQIENEKIEIRADKRDINSFDKIDNIMNNLEDYTNGIPLIPGMVYIEGNGKNESPYIVEANESLTSPEKIEVVKEYLQELYKWGELKIVNIREDERYTNYKIKVYRNHSRNKNKNDFYIEIRVDKHDKDSYLPIITMLNKINKGDSDSQTSNDNTNNNLSNNDNNQSSTDDDINSNSNNSGSDKVENDHIDDGDSNESIDINDNDKNNNNINNIDNKEENDDKKNNIIEEDYKNNKGNIDTQNLIWKANDKSNENNNDTILLNSNVHNIVSQDVAYKGLVTSVVGISGTGLIIGKKLSINRKHKK